MAIDFRSDPAGRFKGWTQRPNDPRVHLQPGWEPRPEYGSGAEEDPTDLDARLAPPVAEPPPYDWGAIRAAVFPEGLGTPPPEPSPAPPPDPDLQAHLGGITPPDPDLTTHLGGVAQKPATVYPPAQARTLSSSAPTPAPQPPASPPVVAQPSARSTSSSGPGGAGPASVRTPDQQGFVSSLLPTAQEVSQKTGIPWQVLIAIPANETGWGSAVFHNNLFGVKGPGAPSKTWEVINGQRVDITDSFRTYDSAKASMEGFAQFLHENPRYSQALAELQKNPNAWPDFVRSLHAAGYATDPNWSNQVISIGQGLESGSNLPHTAMSTVTSDGGGVMTTARSVVGTSGQSGVGASGDSVFPVQGYKGTVADHWGSVKGGSDLFAPRGTPVVAMRGGKVIESGWNDIGGNAVVVQGNDGNQYYYAHGDAAPSVKVGDTVSAGTFLMPVGDTGDAKGKGTHLHIGIGPRILLGSDKYGGTGGDYDAVGLLRDTLSGKTSGGGVQVNATPNFTDDASYVAWTYRHGAGKNLPPSIPGLYATSKPISANDAVPGDMILSGMKSDNPSDRHVGIYAGNGQMLTSQGGVVTQVAMPKDGEFRRLAGVKASDLTRPAPSAGPPPTVTNPIVRYRDNGNGTYDATHADGSTTLEFSVTQVAPVEGGRHPSTIRTSTPRPMGTGADEGGPGLSDPPMDTYYHGTPTEFGTVDPHALLGSNLYGPGYYVTSSPTVAGGNVEKGDPNDPANYNPTFLPGYVYKPGYAQKGMNTNRLDELQKQLEQDQATLKHAQTMDPTIFAQFGADRAQEIATWEANVEDTKQKLSDLVKTQPNVRQIGVPKSLNFFDMDHPLSPEESTALASVSDTFMPNTFAGEKGTDAYYAILADLVEQGYDADEAKDQISVGLSKAGYDGIAHVGGARTGTPPHDVRIIFPEHVGKVKNLISGEWGGSDLLDPKSIPQQTDKDANWLPDKSGGHAVNQGETPLPDPTDKGVTWTPKQEQPKPANQGEVKPPKPLINTGPGLLPGMSIMGVGADSGGDSSSDDGQDEEDFSYLDTPLSADGEQKFQAWKAKYAPQDSGADYDLRGAYSAGLKPDPTTGHWPDTFKKPNHPTFSDQSKFAKDYPDRAGHWHGDTYLPPVFLNPSTGSYEPYKPVKQPSTQPSTQPSVGAGAGEGGDYDPNDIDPLTGLPRGLPANQVIPQAIAAAPGAVGDIFSRIGTTAHDLLPTPEQQDKSWVPAPPPEPQKPILPAPAETQPVTPPEDLTTTSPVTAPLTLPTPATPPATPNALGLPTLAPDNPIMQQARGEKPNPLDVNTAIGRAVTQSVVPEPIRQAGVDVPVLGKITGEDVGAQVLSPGSLINAATAGSVALESALAKEVPVVAPRIAAEVAAAVAGNLGQTPLDTGTGMVLGKVAGAVLPKVIPPLVHDAVPFVKALADSPVGKFLTEDKGSVNANVAFKVGRNVLAGTQIGGIMGIAPDLATDPQQDPDWWTHVVDDYAHGALTGGAEAMGITGAKYGLDRTVTPTIAKWFNTVFNPRMLIPDATAQVAAATRANMAGRAGVLGDIIQSEGRNLFGKPGQGLNTAEAAAFAETERTLQGFVSKDGTRVTPDQEAWLQERLKYEDDAQTRLAAAKVIGPTQNVVAGPPGTPGPSVHITHLYDQEVTDAQQAANRGLNRLGWRDADIVHPRGKTIDPTIDPNTPRTLAEAIAEHVRDPLNNPKPLDDLVTRFEVSAYQTEKSIANRNFWDVIRPLNKKAPGALVAHNKIAPSNWVRPNDAWGFGQGARKFRFDPALANYMDNLTGVNQSAPWLQWYGRNVAAPLKSVLFTGSTAHLFNTAYRVATTTPLDQQGELFRSYIMPTLFKGGYGNLLVANKDLALDAASHGLTAPRVAAEGINPQHGFGMGIARMVVGGGAGYGAGYTQARARGETEDEAQRQGFMGAVLGAVPGAPGVGAVIKAVGKDVDIKAAASMADILHHAIFREGLPAAKLGMYDILTRAGVDGDIAASHTNNTLGGIDPAKLGRSPWVHDLMRYGLIAGDWTEGQMRTLGNAFMPTSMGAHTRSSLVKGLASYMATVEAFNYLFNGHPTWNNGDGNEYKLEVTGLLNGIAGVTGNDGIRSVSPTDGSPMRSFIDPMPPIRWMMETLGEGVRQAAYTQGQLESTFGAPESGQRLMNLAGGDLSQGQLPPDVRGKIGQDITARLGPGPNAIGAMSEMLRGQQYDWTGKPLDPPDLTTGPGWETLLGRAATPFAPALATSVLSNVDAAHPSWRSHPGDAFIEALGLTRVNRSTALGQNLSAVDKVKQDLLHVTPNVSKALEDSHQASVAANDKERADALAALTAPDSQNTHAQTADKLHQISIERSNLSRRQEIADDYASKVPEGPMRDTVQKLLENVWNVPGSPLGADIKPADLNPSTDIDALAKAYWSPQGVDPKDDKAVRQARTNVLNDFAAAHGEDPEALQDWIKWQAQHQDDLSKSTPPIKALPNVSSGDLGQITSDYLHQAEDEHGQLIQDVNVRGDKMRAYLKDQATRIGVSPDTLLERINLRLSPVDSGLASPIEKSYNAALQTFFNSRDADAYPRYQDENGKAVGKREDWDIWDKQIADVGASMASKLPKWRNLYQQQERGNNAREQYLINNPSNTDYERWFGFGRSMTEPEWKQYTSGKLVGYTDLSRFADRNPPANETIRRDKIQELYRASNMDERLHTRVKIWLNGTEREVPLIAGYAIARKFMRNSAGRSLASMASHDDPDPSHPPAEDSTVGADDGTQ